MAKKEITSRPGLFGTTNHYDSRGKKIVMPRGARFALPMMVCFPPTTTTRRAIEQVRLLPDSLAPRKRRSMIDICNRELEDRLWKEAQMMP